MRLNRDIQKFYRELPQTFTIPATLCALFLAGLLLISFEAFFSFWAGVALIAPIVSLHLRTARYYVAFIVVAFVIFAGLRSIVSYEAIYPSDARNSHPVKSYRLSFQRIAGGGFQTQESWAVDEIKYTSAKQVFRERPTGLLVREVQFRPFSLSGIPSNDDGPHPDGPEVNYRYDKTLYIDSRKYELDVNLDCPNTISLDGPSPSSRIIATSTDQSSRALPSDNDRVTWSSQDLRRDVRFAYVADGFQWMGGILTPLIIWTQISDFIFCVIGMISALVLWNLTPEILFAQPANSEADMDAPSAAVNS